MTTDAHPMETRPVLPLLLAMATPAILSMLVQSCYNIVDSIFVSRLGEEALTAVSLAFPLQNLVLAVAVGLGVGLNAMMARNLGLKNQQQVNQAASHGMVLTAIHAVFFLLLGLFGVKPFFHWFAAEGAIFDQGVAYASIVVCFAFGSLFHITIEKIFQARGNMMIPMAVQAFGAVVNILLDPVLIFGWGPVPALGVPGAAIATVIGQLTACGLSVWLFWRYPGGVRLQFRGFRFDKTMLKQLYGVAVPSGLMMALPSVLIGLLNGILYGISQTAVAVLGVYFKLQTFVYMPANGVVQGLRPIISYNYGAGCIQRLRQALQWALLVTGAIMAAGTLLCWLLPAEILSVFDAKPSMMAIGIPALRIISLGFLVSTVGVICAGAFEALGMGGKSLLVSLLRQLLVIVPGAWLLVGRWGFAGVWATFPLAEGIAALVAAVLFYHTYRRLAQPT